MYEYILRLEVKQHVSALYGRHPHRNLYSVTLREKNLMAVRSEQPTLNIYTGFIPSQLVTNTSGCCYSL